jgi:formylglycine-generating enzyme required for sulfatase activity
MVNRMALPVVVICTLLSFFFSNCAKKSTNTFVPNEPDTTACPDNMIIIPAGYFIDANGNTITQTNSFYIGTAEITQEDYNAVMDTNPSFYQGNNKPAHNVSWLEAIIFCNKFSKLNGRDTCYTFDLVNVDTAINLKCNFSKNGFRLPTIDEWEYAYRAGAETHFYWGKNWKNANNIVIYPLTAADSNEIDTFAWWKRNNNPEGPKDVKQKIPNVWGLYDMAGNVSEWCWDRNAVIRFTNHTDYTGDLGPELFMRSTMGGAYDRDAFALTVRYAFGTYSWKDGWSAVGLRIVCTIR